jgi:F-type H+-transporting ATPase subunit b
MLTLRNLFRSAVLVAVTAVPLLAQEAGKAADDTNLLAPRAGLMFWTLVIFTVLFFTLARFAFGPLTQLVRDREKALEDALASARRDRDEAARILGETKAALEAARVEAQKFIAEAHVTADKLRGQLLEETKKQQDELLARAKRDIGTEKTRAIAELRSEAIDLALKGASRVIEKNLDDATNRKLVEDFLKTVGQS